MKITMTRPLPQRLQKDPFFAYHNQRYGVVIAGKSGMQNLPAIMRAAGFSAVETGEIAFAGFPKSGYAVGRITLHV